MRIFIVLLSVLAAFLSIAFAVECTLDELMYSGEEKSISDAMSTAI